MDLIQTETHWKTKCPDCKRQISLKLVDWGMTDKFTSVIVKHLIKFHDFDEIDKELYKIHDLIFDYHFQTPKSFGDEFDKLLKYSERLALMKQFNFMSNIRWFERYFEHSLDDLKEITKRLEDQREDQKTQVPNRLKDGKLTHRILRNRPYKINEVEKMELTVTPLTHDDKAMLKEQEKMKKMADILNLISSKEKRT